MTSGDQIAIALSLIGVVLWGLCLIVGLVLDDSYGAGAVALAATCFLTVASAMFWREGLMNIFREDQK